MSNLQRSPRNLINKKRILFLIIGLLIACGVTASSTINYLSKGEACFFVEENCDVSGSYTNATYEYINVTSILDVTNITIGNRTIYGDENAIGII